MEMHDSTVADPPEVRNKIASLQSQKALIEDLTLRLQHAQTEYRRLETEIKAYRASVAPIRKCPEEVLLMIFQAYSKQNPTLVIELLSVCHRWYDIAVNSPCLWSHIDIRFGITGSASPWDIEAQATLTTRMIKACLKYSASVPLHITIDCRELESAASLLNQYLLHCLQEIDPNNYISKDMELAGLDLTRLTTDASRCHPYHAITSISELIGEGVNHMRRWASLEIILPAQDPEGTLGGWILRVFNGSAPNLVKLSVSLMSSVLMEHKITRCRGFRDLFSLEVLELLGGNVSDLDFLPLKLDSIKCLTLETYNTELHQSLQLSRFTHLEKLVLHCHPDSDAISSSTITLPRLQSLSFSGYPNVPVRWNVPTLQLLKLDGYRIPAYEWLPDMQTVHVCVGYLLYPAHPETKSCLHQILSKYTTMQQLTLPTNLRSKWERLVQELTETQELPLVLPVVSFARDDRYY